MYWSGICEQMFIVRVWYYTAREDFGLLGPSKTMRVQWDAPFTNSSYSIIGVRTCSEDVRVDLYKTFSAVLEFKFVVCSSQCFVNFKLMLLDVGLRARH